MCLWRGAGVDSLVLLEAAMATPDSSQELFDTKGQTQGLEYEKACASNI